MKTYNIKNFFVLVEKPTALVLRYYEHMQVSLVNSTALCSMFRLQYFREFYESKTFKYISLKENIVMFQQKFNKVQFGVPSDL